MFLVLFQDINEFELMLDRDDTHEIQQYFVEKAVDVNSCFSNGRTPLMVAARNGSKNAVQKLLDMGADANICTTVSLFLI